MPKIFENRADLENGLNTLGQLDSCNFSTDIESSFDFYAEYELDPIDHNKTILV